MRGAEDCRWGNPRQNKPAGNDPPTCRPNQIKDAESPATSGLRKSIGPDEVASHPSVFPLRHCRTRALWTTGHFAGCGLKRNGSPAFDFVPGQKRVKKGQSRCVAPALVQVQLFVEVLANAPQAPLGAIDCAGGLSGVCGFDDYATKI